MEDDAVVEAFVGQRDDALDMLGRNGGQQLDIDGAVLKGQDQVRRAGLGEGRCSA
jgi:hypothetical protein